MFSRRFCSLLLAAPTATLLFAACSRPDQVPPPPTPVDTTVLPPPPPPPPPADSNLYVSRVEEDYQQSNPNILRRNKDYSFYYDSSRRVTAVGIRNYSPVGLDTATCRCKRNGRWPCRGAPANNCG
ncbi:MAG: hypothetical protein EOO11_22740 [Chitinophagaceae bacterium]|nr:MAG: hypothetical protein EOO11_22740 [Chitinophagaceae bacterium]